MAALAELTTADIAWLNGEAGYPGSPIAPRDKADLVKLGTRLNELALISSGTVLVANGQTTATVAIGTAFNGKPAVATLQDTTTSALYVKAAVVAAGVLTVTIDQDPADAGGVLVGYSVDGR